MIRTLLIALLASSLLSGCNETEPQPSTAGSSLSHPYKVVATTGMVADLVKQIVGEQGEVVGLMGEGVDPHLYKPTRNDVRQLLDADIVFYNGLLLEGRMVDTFSRVGRGGKPVYPVTEGLDEKFLREPPEFQGHVDPHVWMDVSAWSQCATQVSQALGDLDPAHASEYTSRAVEYQQQLTKLDAYVREVIASIPQQQRLLVTAHDAFGYFSRAYDIPEHAVQGISTDSEAGVDDVNQLVNLIVERQVRAIFVESSVSQKNIEAVIEGAQQRGWEVQVGGELFSDAMGAPGTYEGTYIGMIDHNASTIARALGGTVPEGGFQAWLKSAPQP